MDKKMSNFHFPKKVLRNLLLFFWMSLKNGNVIIIFVMNTYMVIKILYLCFYLIYRLKRNKKLF